MIRTYCLCPVKPALESPTCSVVLKSKSGRILLSNGGCWKFRWAVVRNWIFWKSWTPSLTSSRPRMLNIWLQRCVCRMRTCASLRIVLESVKFVWKFHHRQLFDTVVCARNKVVERPSYTFRVVQWPLTAKSPPTKSPRHNPPRQNPPRQNPSPTKSPPTKSPPTKSPRTKSPRHNPSRQNPPDKIPPKFWILNLWLIWP